jgi:transposase InsO family protein
VLTMRKQHEPAYRPNIRKKWYFLVEKAGKTVGEVCSLYAISRKTYYKWLKSDRDSRTYHRKNIQPKTKLTNEVKVIVEEQKRLTNYGPKKMQLLLRRRNIFVSTTIIYRFYKRKGLVRRPQKRLPWYQPLKEHIIPKKPGDVIQSDAKYVWENNKRKYQRTFIDIFTGMHHAVITGTLEAQDTIRAFEEAERKFPFKILGVQNDNGSENRGVFHQYLGERGIAHYFIPKSSPNWDGAVERAHGVIDQEYYLNPTRPWKTLSEYLDWYNHERIHLGKYLNGLTPWEKYLEWKSVTSRC